MPLSLHVQALMLSYTSRAFSLASSWKRKHTNVKSRQRRRIELGCLEASGEGRKLHCWMIGYVIHSSLGLAGREVVSSAAGGVGAGGVWTKMMW